MNYYTESILFLINVLFIGEDVLDIETLIHLAGLKLIRLKISSKKWPSKKEPCLLKNEKNSN